MKTGYRSRQPYAACDRCAFIRRVQELRAEWTGLRVCEECWDPRPPQLDPPKLTAEGLPVPNARPEPTDVFLTDDTPVTSEDL